MIYLYLFPPVFTRLLLSVPQKCQVLLAFPHAISSPGPRFPTLLSDCPLPTISVFLAVLSKSTLLCPLIVSSHHFVIYLSERLFIICLS